MKSKHFYGVILAGGVGARFWPLSRATSPKQLLRIAGEESLLKATIKRLRPLVPLEKISIVTNSTQAETIMTHLAAGVGARDKKKSRRPISRPCRPEIIAEPVGRNTAPAIGLAALTLLKKDPEAVMAVLPSDHLIGNGRTFLETLRAAERVAREGRLVTFGIVPTRPETGYGYIKAAKGAFKNVGKIKVRRVERFVEKPALKKAKKYLAQDGYYWNSGIFVWKAKTILEEIRLHLPGLYGNLLSMRRGADVKDVYKKIRPVSIDRGVLEKTSNIAVIEARFPWSDMGSLPSLGEVFPPDRDGNVIKGRVVDIGSRNSLIIGSDRVVATIGLKDMILIDTPDATLVCPKERAQEVKETVEILKKKGCMEHASHLTVERPWGAYTVLEKGDNYKIKKIRVEPGRRLSLQTHSRRSEHWVVVSGRARIQRGEETVLIGRNESTYIPRGVRHRLENPSKTKPLEIIEVQNGSYVEEDDIVRHEDDYERGF
ncbi:MAG: mannose-1-phosphate guanylyltransferase/mannose-6-phosphate isomerase [Deltaproteobacteria bacterium]|nr:mannose-1-phosphate guanylyltransferase/mannose-6-phosphate isomerase [Deltaproteobacteria bacterium]